MNHASICAELSEGARYRFHDWPNPAVPETAAGLYAVWDQNRFIYIGMAGHGLTTERLQQLRNSGGKRHGIWNRLHSHASGRRSGDAFCLYVCDRYLLASLNQAEIREIARGDLSLDRLTRAYIRERLDYRLVVLPSGRDALTAERRIRQEGLNGSLPELNPAS